MVLSISGQLLAQTDIAFENGDYKSVEVFDLWSESPFAKGLMAGNCAVIDNHLKDESDPSEKILAVQRSRFGSNTFGVKVDLQQPFRLTASPREVSVLVHRPYSGRVMIAGLGRRVDKPCQSPHTVQFTMISKTDIPADSWQKVPVMVKGDPGVIIYSVVIVPDCESPHDYKEDGICYIDDIKVAEY